MKTPQKIRVLIVDDHHLVRAGIASLLSHQPDIGVVGEAADGSEAIAKVKSLSPDIVLMDISMPGMSGIEATEQIVAENPSAKVLILTQYDQEEYVKRVMQCGAIGYLLKSSLADDLLQAIRSVHRGEKFFAPAISKSILDSFGKQSNGEEGKQKDVVLSPRETEILQLLASGLSNQQIANKLFISVRTVEFHRANIIEKLGLHDVASLVKYALQKKLIRLDS